MNSKTLVMVGLAVGAVTTLSLLMAASRKREEETGFAHVRPAGPEAMKDEPEDWDIVDEQVDQSFPASDPPGNY